MAYGLDSGYSLPFSALNGSSRGGGQRKRHLSPLPEASFAPQGEKATEVTWLECPSKVLRLWPLATSQTMTVLREGGNKAHKREQSGVTRAVEGGDDDANDDARG